MSRIPFSLSASNYLSCGWWITSAYLAYRTGRSVRSCARELASTRFVLRQRWRGRTFYRNEPLSDGIEATHWYDVVKVGPTNDSMVVVYFKRVEW